MQNLRRMISALLVLCMVFAFLPPVNAAASGAGRVLLDETFPAGQTVVWVDGVEYPVQGSGSSRYVDLPADVQAGAMVIYDYYVGNPEDVHTQYPVGMKVWELHKNEDGSYTPAEVEELENILQYSGSSIRITGTKGIRMITSIEQSKKSSLVSGDLAGYTLQEYGTVISWSSDLEGGKPLILGEEYAKSNYAYKRGKADPIFKYEGSLMQYTNVLVGFELDQCAGDIAMRSYMILENEAGEQITVYGGIVHRSIGYIAWQNRYVFQKGTSSYNYVWEIIRAVYGDISEIVFQTNGGSDIAPVTVENGSPLEQPADPVREGFTFAGWYTDSALTKEYDFSKNVQECLVLYAKWDVVDTGDLDDDGVPDEVEEIFGLTPGTDDSDGDGIDDYTEIYVLGTDPSVHDSGEDGDFDGLSNLDELTVYGTDPIRADTDMDGINDGAEFAYGTNPLVADTDADSMSDGHEIELGLNPLAADEIWDVEQAVPVTAMDDALFVDNDAIPAISGYTGEKLTEIIDVVQTEDSAVSDNRAVVGKGVDIDLDAKAELTLTFQITDPSRPMAIMRLDDETGWEFMETDSDYDSIQTEITEGGTYCVMDLDVLLPLIGVDLDSLFGEVAALELMSDSVEEEEYEAPAEPEVVETEPAETEAVETEPAETEAVETEPAETEAEETEPAETEAEETEPAETEAVETEPAETEAVETEPAETEAVETEPAETEAVETEPAETEAVETEPAETEAVETEPAETEAVETEPAETEAVETEPAETEAVETEPAETEAVETEPAETEAEETEPAETEPVETEPEETEPEDQENSASGKVEMDKDILDQISDLVVPVPRSGVAMGQADIIFAIDSTGSMYDEINNVANNIAIFVQRLTTEYHVNVNFALVDYKDITADGPDTTIVMKNGYSNWYTNPAAYANMISSLYVYGGGDGPETAVDALEVSRRLDMRHSAKKFIIVVTDADYKVANNYGISSMQEEIELLKAQGIITSVVAPYYYQSTYRDLYESNNGIFADIYGDFATELLKLADMIGEEVNESNWILLDNFEHIALNEPLSPTSGDTDGDGKSDYDELEAPVQKNYDTLLKFWLKFKGIPEELIEEYFLTSDGVHVTMYPFKSSPVHVDTDFDGISDKYDNAPKNNTFTGKQTTEYCDTTSSYTFDYRNFFKNNKVYHEDLGTLSLMFSTFIYADGGFDYDKPVQYSDSASLVAAMDLRSLMKLHGFQDIVIYDLDDEYQNGNTNTNVVMVGYTDDNVTEVAFGHRPVTYNGVTKDIVSVIVRGTNGTIEEWSSNFDIGDLNEFAASDEWEDPDNHRGFDITANRVLQKLYSYEASYVSAGATYWVMGHSRGASIANIVAAKLVDNSREVYGYTFACPNTTTDANYNDSKYGCIFNLINDDDFVPTVPMTGWDFHRYGKSATLDMTGSMEKKWHKITGLKTYNQMSAKNLDELVAALEEAGGSWEECYTFTCDCHGDGTNNNIIEWMDPDVIPKIPTRVMIYGRLGMELNFWGKQSVCQCPAYLMQALADLCQKQGTFDQIVKVINTYQLADRYEHARNKIILAKKIGGIDHPHYCATYYLLTQYVTNDNFS